MQHAGLGIAIGEVTSPRGVAGTLLRRLHLDYTGEVFKTLAPFIWILVLAAHFVTAQNPSGTANQPPLPVGKLIPHQVCQADADQSYALYLPSNYSPRKSWPIIYVFDPDARGSVPLEIMKDAAERYGYILAGSNNSRNGSWQLETSSAQAMSVDTHARLAIDNQRVYFAGFSGGARVASLLAQRCKCAAGVLLNGAGFAGTPPSHDAMFAVFAAVGNYDFNYPELSELDKQLQQAGFPHVLRHFDGSHQWAPAEVMDEALAWFKLMAMKEKRGPLDPAFVAAQKAKTENRAQALERSGDLYEAWREYQQAIATFDGLADTASLRQSASALEKQKDVREGAKREAQEIREQRSAHRRDLCRAAATWQQSSQPREHLPADAAANCSFAPANGCGKASR